MHADQDIKRRAGRITLLCRCRRDARDAVARVEGCLNWLAMIENTLKSDPRSTGENGAPLTGLRAVRAVMRNLIAETEYQREVERAEYLEDR